MSRRLCLLLSGLVIIVAVHFMPGCDELITEVTEITVAGHPMAHFGAKGDTIGCDTLTVQFIDSSRGPRQIWEWDFGDGEMSNDTNPIHFYDSGGVFTVRLTIYDINVKDTGQDTKVRPKYIIIGTTSAEFSAVPETTCANSEILFFPPTAPTINTWLWDFGDSATLVAFTSDSVAHSYDSLGEYWAKLTVADSCGQRTDSHLVVITACPTARIWDSLSEGCWPQIVQFRDSSVASEGLGINTWRWDFGDGSTADVQDPIHTYDTTGAYVVTLTVYDTSDGTGGKATATDTIRVYDPVVAGFTANPTEGCDWANRQFVVKFRDRSLGRIHTRLWRFGDGDTLYNDTVPAHAYEPGIYYCSLFVAGYCETDTSGVPTDTIRDSVVLSTPIVLSDELTIADFTITDTSGAPVTTGDTLTEFTFTDISSGVVTKRIWDLGDTTLTDTNKVVTHTYSEPGTYNVQLTIGNGCTDAIISPVKSITITDTGP